MTKRFWPRLLLTTSTFLTLISFGGQTALAQPPKGPPGSGDGGGMPWQVAALFTANWVLAAVAVAVLSRPSKRPDKPKKIMGDEAE